MNIKAQNFYSSYEVQPQTLEISMKIAWQNAELRIGQATRLATGKDQPRKICHVKITEIMTLTSQILGSGHQR